MKKVWLGGEGPSELGDRDQPAHTWEREGALEALLRKVKPEGWEVEGATRWWALKKYDAGKARQSSKHADERHVRALALQAEEQGCDAVVFSRDLDSDEDREAAIEAGISWAQGRLALRIAGGVAKPALEGWLLALLGESRTDELSRGRVAERLKEHGVVDKKAEDYVALIDQADLATGERGSTSLRQWLERASAALGE